MDGSIKIGINIIKMDKREVMGIPRTVMGIPQLRTSCKSCLSVSFNGEI